MRHLNSVYCFMLILVISELSYAANMNEIQNIRTESTVTDYDGNIYPVVKIGNQIWMAENLRTTHYSDGTPINDGSIFTFYPYNVAMDGLDTTRYYFYYNNNAAYAEDYGCLYNWFAAVKGTIGSDSNPSGIQGVSPAGWHIPSIDEWDELVNFIGENSGLILQKGGGTGFDAVLGGYRHDMRNEFGGLDGRGAYISTTVEPDGYITLFTLMLNDSKASHWAHRKTTGYSVRCIKDNADTGLSDERASERPKGFSLYQNYPNPFNPSTTIHFSLQKSEHITLKIYNLAGQEVTRLVDEVRSAGEHKIKWRAKGLPSGIYFCRLQAGEYAETSKLILQK